MRQHLRSGGRFHAPLGGASFRLSIIVCFVFAFGLLFFGRAEAYVFERIRHAIEEVTSPLYEFFSPPLATARRAIASAFNVFTVYGENERLREENTQLKAWQARALSLEQKVAGYEALLGLPIDPDIAYRAARVVNDPGGPFVRTALINLGTRDGVAEGQAVVGPDGLVGRLVSAGATASRVLLITDLNSRIPVRIDPLIDPTTNTDADPSGTTGATAPAGEETPEPSDANPPVDGMLIGDNDGAPAVSYLHTTPGLVIKIKPGDRVVTSGKDGLLPPSIFVGTVKTMIGDRAIIAPATDFGRLSYVRVLDYSSPFAGVPRTGKGPALLHASGVAVPAGEPSVANVPDARPAKPPAKPPSAKTPKRTMKVQPAPPAPGVPEAEQEDEILEETIHAPPTQPDDEEPNR